MRRPLIPGNSNSVKAYPPLERFDLYIFYRIWKRKIKLAHGWKKVALISAVKAHNSSIASI